MENFHLKMNMKSQGTLNNQTVLRKNRARGFPFADLKTYYKAVESKHYGAGIKTLAME